MVTPRLFVASCSATVMVSDEAIVSKFVFIEELTGVPLVRQVEFRIDFVSGVTPVTNDPYRLTRPNERTSWSFSVTGDNSNIWLCTFHSLSHYNLILSNGVHNCYENYP